MDLYYVNELIPHPKNSYFFDDIEGDNWKEFLESIKTRGVIEPLVITPDCVVVSGHQRMRACKELGVEQVKAEIRRYDNEDQVLQDLIETNIRQRGIGNPNAVKMGRCIKELERIYGISHGGKRNNVPLETDNPKTQKELAEIFGIDERTLRGAKKLADLPKEIQDMVESGKITASTASRVIAKLSDEDKQKLIESLDPDGKYTQKEVQGYIDRIKELENRPPEVVPPADYESLKEKSKLLARQEKDVAYMAEALSDTRKKLKALEAEKNDPKKQEVENINRSALMFNAGIANFIEKFGGYVWLTDHIESMGETEKKGFLSGVNAIEAWVYQMKTNLGGVEV